MSDTDPLLDDSEWDEVANRPKFAAYCSKLIRQEWRDWESVLASAFETLENRPPTAPGTPWATDWALAQGDEFLEGTVALASEHFQRLMFAARDYVENVLLMLDHDRLLIKPAWSASRGLMEAVLLSCWMLDDSKTPEIRFARALSLLPSAYQGALDTLRRFPDPSAEIQEKREARNDLIAYYEKNGVDVLWKLDKRNVPTDRMTGVRFRGQRASFSHNVTQMAEWYLPHAPYLYALQSGAAHSEAWLLVGINPNSVGEALNSVVLPLFSISEGYIKSLCAYIGLDAQPYAIRNRRRQQALLQRGGATTAGPTRDTAFGSLGSGLLHELGGTTTHD